MIVLLSHFWPEDWPSRRFVPLGYYGVELFFVLSGFLITSILWIDRGIIAAGPKRLAQAMGNFYFRRFLRICPTYYLALFYAWIAGLGVFAGSLPWFATYLTNFYFVTHRLPGSSTHLWSLAVEEQFYLIWPIVILILPRRVIFTLLGLAIFGGVVFRWATTLPNGEYLLPACVDYLAAGAALAVVSFEAPAQLSRILGLSAALSGVLFCIGAGGRNRGFVEVAVMTLSIALVGGAARGIPGIFGNLLQTRAVMYVGRISYGLYLFHNFIPEAVLKACGFYRLRAPAGGALMFVSITLAFAAAAASWHFIERPLKDLRKHFATVDR